MSDKKTAVISGGSGGLGRAAAEYFADRGWSVYSLDIRPSGKPYDGITEITVDLTDSESVSAAAKRVESETDGVHALVSLAGVYFMDSLIEVPEEELKHIFEVNLFGVYRLNREFLPLLRNAHGRSLIVTSELAGMKALPFNGIYSLTKTALQHYTDSLRHELSLLGVKVIEIMPGAFDTGMIKASFASLDKMTEKTRLYGTNTARFRRIMSTQSGGAKPPSVLAKTLWKAAASRRPRLRYKPHNNFLLRLYNVLPRRTQVAVIGALIKTKGEKTKSKKDG